ncbi:sugar kinase [Cryptosporangium aurantiacum]|uniref:2-dehydro-3-deoxygluconokinase n=1 Tax=Cryptosporangium aurantiacum TaxID=134849 RepID=A0A1M7TVH4_9ACTN|nr:sugar kinase [Cryptosporangium aurantiacum]SHN74680.1 2-dehydro-3-deoxygluconokinase [Cryptosporangium aurantiacum]
MSGSKVVCVGEAMVVLTPADDVPLADASTFIRTVGGAELNVALTLVGLGVPTAWLSRLGDDGFGHHIAATARAAGVDVSGLEFDPARPTGLYVKSPGTAHDGSRRSAMLYYRRGSAASALSPGYLARPDVAAVLAGAALVHVSGITPGLSDSAAAFCDALPATIRLCVDLNYRPALWRDRDDAPLRRLLARADEVLLGADEAAAVFGAATPDALRRALPRAERILLKQEERGVLVLDGDRPPWHVPALEVDVVEPVGAGDAFAAGYLAGRWRDLDVEDAVRLGHRCAAAALVVREDRPLELPAWGDLAV